MGLEQGQPVKTVAQEAITYAQHLKSAPLILRGLFRLTYTGRILVYEHAIYTLLDHQREDETYFLGEEYTLLGRGISYLNSIKKPHERHPGSERVRNINLAYRHGTEPIVIYDANGRVKS